MLFMIFIMTAVTLSYVFLTSVLWKYAQKRKMTSSLRIAVGVIYGLCAVMSTHFGVDYSHMMLNVRDMGPLSAGLFFDPVSGILAGLIGGIERYIAGTYWGVGSYTRIACAISTCLAGFVAAAMHIFIFKRKKPSAMYAYFMGAVMEVFHMYVVFITHREDMNMALYVVKTCGPPMIVFTGLGMAASSIALKVIAGEWKNPFRKVEEDEIPVSMRFQFWLFAVTFIILILNFLFTFAIQSQSAIQKAEDTLEAASDDIRRTYDEMQKTGKSINELTNEQACTEAMAIAEAIDRTGGVRNTDNELLKNMRTIYGLVSVTVTDKEGNVIASDGESPLYTKKLKEVLDGTKESLAVKAVSGNVAAGAGCTDGMVQVVIDRSSLTQAVNIAGLNNMLSYYHVGSAGSFDIISDSGLISSGSHGGTTLGNEDKVRLKGRPMEVCFRTKLFDEDSLCRLEELSQGLSLLVRLPVSEVYADRDAQTYETAFAAIILFAVIYVLISMLVQNIVVDNLNLVNASLSRITQGNLDEVVSVRNSSEFASLSNDINQTVSVLKGYIEAAEKRIEQELEFAREIQAASLPRNFSYPRHDFETFATMDPAKEVGGDFYDIFFVGLNKLALVIADVSGKGIPAALFMMRAKTTIRGLAESGQSPSEILYRANNTLCEGNDVDMFVTAWLGIIDLTSGKMVCANAGHEYPAVKYGDGDYELIKDKHGLVLAAMEDVRFTEYEISLNPGDKLFVYTDGIPEAIDSNEEQYGTERLTKALNEVKDEPMDAVLPAVRENIAAFVGDADQFDDITMLGFAYYGVI